MANVLPFRDVRLEELVDINIRLVEIKEELEAIEWRGMLNEEWIVVKGRYLEEMKALRERVETIQRKMVH
jgi:hypothetical protein